MIKKVSITSQLVILFFVILLVASSAFSLITLTRVTSIVEGEVYSRLQTYAFLITLENAPDKEGPNYPDMEIEYYLKYPNKVIVSQDITNYVEADDVEQIVNSVIEQVNASTINKDGYTAKGTFVTTTGEKIYFVCKTNDNMVNYSIVFTNALYCKNLVSNLSIQIILVFIAIILLSVLIIYLWSNSTAKRIRQIQFHIEALPRTQYKEEYEDDSLDEIGELSRSVEKMRNEISHNEETKRDMLQNISHDFKTPISVIKSYAEAEQDGMAGKEAPEIIIKQAEILKHKVNQLLQYNSLEYLKKDREFEDVCMNELITQVVLTYKYKTNIEFEFDLEKDVMFKGYSENLYTVVDNIIDNATRYAKTKIKITLKHNTLIIYNDGEPIDEQFIKNSFRAYEKGSKGQFGLGMSIAKKTIEFFNMNLKVVNEPVGVSFVIFKKN